MNIKKILVSAVASSLLFGVMATPAFADSFSVNFESPYTLGNINGQFGWMKTGTYDVAVVSNTFGFTTFGSQSLRISDAITSGSFGDQTFSKSLTDEAGETDALNGGLSGGVRKSHFEAQFDITSTQVAQQPGMHLSISPDRGDGARMSYLRFEDGTNGINVIFDDVQGTTNPANFVETQIATDLSRAIPHTVKFVMDFLDGPSNDVVKIYIDNNLVHTGTSWENYYRFDSESNPSLISNSRTVDSLLFRESGTATVGDSGKGFLIDNFTISSLTPVAPSVPVITIPANGSTVTTASLVKVDWSDSTGGSFPPFEYQYQAFSDAEYTNNLYTSGWLTNSEIPTPGTPVGTYYVRVKARDAQGTETVWSNGSTSPYRINVVNAPVLIGPPTLMSQCKDNGWKVFSSPVFKNQGECVSYIQSNDHAGKRN